MPFASALNAYCTALGCTGKEIAERCGISPSALTRYRKGDRTPEVSSDTIECLAAGIAELALENNTGPFISKDIIKSVLEGSLVGAHSLGMNFCERLDALMTTLSIRNIEIARELSVSPSYISRIRNGQRMPADRSHFTEVCARFTVEHAMRYNLVQNLIILIDSTGEIVDPDNDPIDESGLVEIVAQWLIGNNVTESDLAAADRLFSKLNKFYFEDAIAEIDQAETTEPSAEPVEQFSRFFYTKDEMREAELLFFDIAARQNVREVFLSSDMPLLDMSLDQEFVSEYRKSVARLIKMGCKITLLHSVERPLVESIISKEMWIPLFLRGNITSLCLTGKSNRLFFHVNNVCDACAMEAEAVMGHQKDGRYHLSTLPEDINYLQKKMRYILEHATRPIEIYQESRPGHARRFKKREKELKAEYKGREVCAGKYENLRITSYYGSSVVVSIACDKPIHLIMHDPKFCYAISRMV